MPENRGVELDGMISGCQTLLPARKLAGERYALTFRGG